MTKIKKFGNNKRIEASALTKDIIDQMEVGDIFQLVVDDELLTDIAGDSKKEFVVQRNRVFRKK